MKRLLITGTTKFVGSSLVKHLKKNLKDYKIFSSGKQIKYWIFERVFNLPSPVRLEII